MPSSNHIFGTAEAARFAGLTEAAVKKYARERLVTPSHRPAPGRGREALYSELDVARLGLVKHLRSLGVPLDLIRDVLRELGYALEAYRNGARGQQVGVRNAQVEIQIEVDPIVDVALALAAGSAPEEIVQEATIDVFRRAAQDMGDAFVAAQPADQRDAARAQLYTRDLMKGPLDQMVMSLMGGGVSKRKALAAIDTCQEVWEQGDPDETPFLIASAALDPEIVRGQAAVEAARAREDQPLVVIDVEAMRQEMIRRTFREHAELTKRKYSTKEASE